MSEINNSIEQLENDFIAKVRAIMFLEKAMDTVQAGKLNVSIEDYRQNRVEEFSKKCVDLINELIENNAILFENQDVKDGFAIKISVLMNKLVGEYKT